MNAISSARRARMRACFAAIDVGGRVRQALRLIRSEALVRRRARRDLARLRDSSDRLLRDIGLDRWSLRMALESDALPPLCTPFERGER